MDLHHKTVSFQLGEVKASEGAWTFSGYAATFGGEPDSYGDVIVKGAFASSLKANPTPMLLWQHDTDEPIGAVASLEETDKGLLGSFELVDTTRGTDAYKLLKRGALRTMSIGYLTKDAEYNADGVRLLKEIELLEISLVSIPANANAVVTAVKADVPFDVLLARSTNHLTLAVDEAKALLARRTAEKREPAARHMDALNALHAAVKAADAALSGIQAEPPAEAVGSTLTRLAFARRRLAHAGLIERIAS